MDDENIYGHFDQLSIFFDDDEVEEYRQRLEELDKARREARKPTQNTGFLTCYKCNLIMPDKLPEKDWVCTGCKKVAEWAASD